MTEYANFVRERKECECCIKRNPGKIQNPATFEHDPDVVSHWSQWLGHHEPKVVIIGQDFGNVAYFKDNKGVDSELNHTNLHLRNLLLFAGFSVSKPPKFDASAPIFLANSILCAKEGDMKAPILTGWINKCVDKHLVRLINYLHPPIVVGMGVSGWRAARRIFSLLHAPLQIHKAAQHEWRAADGTRVFAVGHCSALGRANRSPEQQEDDWRRIGKVVSECSVI